MNIVTKFLMAIMLLAVVTAGVVQTAKAVESDDFVITQVDVDGITIDDRESQDALSVYVERSSTTVVEVWIQGLPSDRSVDDPNPRVKVKVWIGGYEHGDIEDTSRIFEVEPGVKYRKVLRLDIPEDLDASQDYTLHVEVFDDQETNHLRYNVRVQEQRHFLKIQDVIFNPSDLSVEAGKTLFAIVRVENLGDRKEEDVKVTLSVPELGLSTRTYIEELVTNEQCDIQRDCDEDEETSQSSDELFLRIPKGTQPGKYDLVVNVEYDRGFEETEKTFILNVEGGVDGVIAPEERVTISVDSAIKEVAQGRGVVYKVMFANLGTETKQYSLDVTGLVSWATFRVDPSVVTVQPGQTQEMFIFVSANENVVPGNRVFTVNVRSDSLVVKQFNLQTNVVENSLAVGAGVDSFRKGLVIGFIVLLIILVVLLIVLAISKMRRSEERGEEPGAAEGQTYYNYPRY